MVIWRSEVGWLSVIIFIILAKICGHLTSLIITILNNWSREVHQKEVYRHVVYEQEDLLENEPEEAFLKLGLQAGNRIGFVVASEPVNHLVNGIL